MEWQSNPLVLIGIGIGVMFFGYFFGLFEGRGQGYKKRQKEEAEQRKQEPIPPASPPAAQPSLPSLLRLSQDGMQSLQLELDGEPVDTAALTASQRHRLVQLLTMMRPWLEGKPASPPPATPKPAPVSPADKPAATPPAPVSRPAPANVLAPPLKAAKDEPVTPLSMVGQIDVILQDKLASSPLAGKGVRLHDAPGGGVLVYVGLDKYQGIDEVPDEEIKALIRASIAEWENKYTPGI